MKKKKLDRFEYSCGTEGIVAEEFQTHPLTFFLLKVAKGIFGILLTDKLVTQ